MGRGPHRPRRRVRALHDRPDRRRRAREPRRPRARLLLPVRNFPTDALRARLLAHLDGRTTLAETRVAAGDATYRVVHPAAADALLDEADFERDERLPYWAELWPSAVALAKRLAREDLAGWRVVELGCGVGLPAIVARKRGATVLATDHSRPALDFARYNARLNLGSDLQTRLLDWHARAAGVGAFDLAIAADVLYEKRNVPALASLVPDLLAPGGEALVADPRRKNAPLFLELMEERGFRSSTEEAVVSSGGRTVTVLLHRLSRSGGEDGG